MKLDKELLDSLFEQAKANPRLRQNLDLRTSAEDNSQRMLNALLPGTEVAVHKHPMSNENVLLLVGKMDEIIYEAYPQPLPKGMGVASPKSSPERKDLGVHTADPMLYGLLKEYAEGNRKNPTEAESILWNVLKAKGIGYKFRQQHIIEDFIVDFYCNELNLTIELDGGYHNVPEQMKSDAERTARLKELGYTEIRFTNEQVLFDIDNTIACIKRVCDTLKETGASPKSSPEGKDLVAEKDGVRFVLVEKERIHLDPSTGNFGCVVPADTWHTVDVFEPSVIYEGKDGKYGEEGSVSLALRQAQEPED